MLCIAGRVAYADNVLRSLKARWRTVKLLAPSIMGEDGGSGGGGRSKFRLFGRWLGDMGAYFSGSSESSQISLLGGMCAIDWGARS